MTVFQSLKLPYYTKSSEIITSTNFKEKKFTAIFFDQDNKQNFSLLQIHLHPLRSDQKNGNA